jgi:SAM-dependent methyltransferase
VDEVAKYNIERWRELAEADALFTRPVVTLDAAAAQEMVDREGRLGNVAGKRVLCLASGGGQQTIAFALLGAKVTVFDLSEAQLQRDAEAAARFGMDIERVQGDMRDLSALPHATFDIVYHAYSLGFVPQANLVFQQVARVLRPHGLYHFHCANPFYLGMTQDDWNGEGYTLKKPYVEGAAVTYADQPWVYDRSQHSAPIRPVREYCHTLGALVSGLVAQGFILLHIADVASSSADLTAEPGTWSHFVALAPPWLDFWTVYRPDLTLI